MTIAQTSLLAYEDLEPRLGRREGEVYAALRALRCACNKDIALFLHWPINCVTGRIYALREKGIVRSAGKKEHASNGRLVEYWESR